MRNLLNVNNSATFVLALVLVNGAIAGEKNTYYCNPGDGPYITGGLGVSKFKALRNTANRQDVRFKENLTFRLAVGSQFSGMRVEFEPSYARIKYNSAPYSGRMNITSLLGNLYLGFPFEGRFISYNVAPYAGAGIGIASVNSNWQGVLLQSQSNPHSHALAYQGIAGLRFTMANDLGLNLEYRYFSTEKLNVIGKRLRAHSGNLGITYRF